MYKSQISVKVKPSWESNIFKTYYNFDTLRNKKGEVFELYSDGRARVRFPKINQINEEGQEVIVEDFIWPFWIKDLEITTDVITKKKKHIRRSGRALEAKRSTTRRLKLQGMTIKQIAEKLEAPYNTVLWWIYENR